MQKGDKVRYKANVNDESLSWGCNTDPRDLLSEGMVYTVRHIEEHTWHTRVFLEEVEGYFNTVWFEVVNPILRYVCENHPDRQEFLSFRGDDGIDHSLCVECNNKRLADKAAARNIVLQEVTETYAKQV